MEGLAALHDEVRHAFDSADKDKGGTLDLDEFVAAFTGKLGTKEHLTRLFMKVDANADGTIDWEEFSNFMLLESDATSDLSAVTKSSYREAHIRPRETTPAEKLQQHSDLVSHLLLVPSQEKLLSSSRDGTVRVWAVGSLTHLKTIKVSTAWVSGTCFLAGSNRIAAACLDATVHLYDGATYEPEGRISQLGNLPLCISTWEDQGRERLLIGDDAGAVSLYDASLAATSSVVASAARVHGSRRHMDWVTQATFISDLNMAVSSSLDGTLQLGEISRVRGSRDLVSGGAPQGEPAKGIYCFDWSPTLKLVASGGIERHVSIWNPYTRSGRPIVKLEGHTASVHTVIVNDSAQQLVSCSSDKYIKVWDLRTFRCLQTLYDKESYRNEDTITALALEPSRAQLVSANVRLKAWPSVTDETGGSGGIGHLAPVVAALHCGAFGQVVSGDVSSRICVWDVDSGMLVFQFSVNHQNLSAMSFDGAGRRLITGGDDGVVRIWNFSSGQCLRELDAGSPAEVAFVRYVHEGQSKLIVAGGWSKELLVWRDAPSSVGVRVEPERRMLGHQEDILSAVFIPPSQLVTASYDGHVFVWNLLSGALKFKLWTPQKAADGSDSESVCKLHALEKRSRALVGACADGTIRFWNVKECGLVMERHAGHASGEQLVELASNDSDRLLFTGDSVGCLKSWDVSRLVNVVGMEQQSSVVELHFWRAHRGAISSLEFIGSRSMLLSSGRGSASIKVWHISQPDGTPSLAATFGAGLSSLGAAIPGWHIDSPDEYQGVQYIQREPDEEEAAVWEVDGGEAPAPVAAAAESTVGRRECAPEITTEEHVANLLKHHGRLVLSRASAGRPGSKGDKAAAGAEPNGSTRGGSVWHGPEPTTMNLLKALLIHDATADKAAAALDVAVGFSADPETLPGLAHFTEHMLFLGTQKYPEEDSYTTFLSAHGGRSNAYTAYENTQYYFDVQHPFLAEALDRFAQFFLGPLFTPSATARELNAIESEHAKNLQSDSWRLQEIGRWLARRDHPYHKFGTGSLATLRDVPERFVRLELRAVAADGGVAVATSLTASHRPGLAIRDALVRFHTEHYSSSRMRLVVLGRETLDELEALVAPLFGGVQRRSDLPPVDHGHPYGAAQLCRRVQLAPVRNLRTLSLLWPVPPLRPLWSNKPQRFLGHLIGHESKGSIFSLLRACGWVESLSAGEGHGARSYSTFEVKMVLTQAGDEHVDEIARLVFEYIALLRSAPPERWVWEECRELGELGFRFAEPMEPCDAVGHLASALDFFPPEHVMSASFIFGDFEPAEIVAILSELTPRRVILTHQSPVFEGRLKLVEPRYGALYSTEPLSEELVQSWERATPRDALHLPLPNSFIPTDFSLVCDDAAAGERAEKAVDPSATARCPAGHALCLERVKPDDYRELDGDRANCDVCEASYDYADGGYHCSACGDWDCCVRCGAAGGATAEASHQPSLTNAAATAAVDAVASAPTDASSDATDAPALVSPSALAALPSPPTCLRNDRSAELWHKLDRTFRRPRVNVLINVLAPSAYESPAGAVMARLFMRLLGDELNEYSYDADVAGLHYKLQNSVTGLQLMVAGYSHKLPVLLGKVLGRVRDPELDPERFAVMREQAARDYQNVYKDSPYQLAVYGMSMLLEEKKWHLADYLEFVTSDACTVEATRAFAMRSLLGRLRPQAFCHGNMSASEATAMVEEVCRLLGASPLSTSELPQLRCLEIPAGRPVTIRYHPNRLKAPLAGLPSADETNSAVEVYLQAGRDSRPRAEMLDILVQVLHTRAEQQLRTVEQLGYLVWCTTRFDRGVAGLRIIVQSSTHDAATLDARIEAFLETVPSILAQLSQEDFASYRKALIDQTLETDKRLRDETMRHWNEIVPYGEYDFDRAAKDACSFAKQTRRDLCAFWNECLSHKSAQRRRVSSQVFAPRHALPPKPPNALYLDSIDELLAFKYALNAYPAPGAKGRLSEAWGRCPGGS